MTDQPNHIFTNDPKYAAALWVFFSMFRVTNVILFPISILEGITTYLNQDAVHPFEFSSRGDAVLSPETLLQVFQFSAEEIARIPRLGIDVQQLASQEIFEEIQSPQERGEWISIGRS